MVENNRTSTAHIDHATIINQPERRTPLQHQKKTLNRWFNETVQTYREALYRFARKRVYCQQDAEDIVQEALMRAYSALKTYSPERVQQLCIKPWLYTITQNVILNYKRSLYASQQYPPTSLDQLDRDTIDMTSETNPNELIEYRDAIGEALRQVSPQYRTCLMLKSIYGLSQQEIAEQLNITPGCVGAYISRGRNQFRHAYSRQLRELDQTSP